MTDLPTVTAFLGWCSLINIGLLVLITVWLVAFREWTKRIHSALLGVDAKELDGIYFRYLANYKMLVVIFNIVPYVVLRFLM